MQIKILRTRGEVDHSVSYHSHHSGVLIDDTLLIDLGEPEYLDLSPEAILIMHLHPDHAYFVRDKKEKPPGGIPIFAPEKTENFDVKILDKKKTIADYTIHPILTHHSLTVRSQAYCITKNSRKILYTGDMIWINKKNHPLFEGLDLVITEGSYIRKGGLVRKDKKTGKIYGHTGIPDLVHLFKDYCNHIVLMHFGSWFYRDTGQARKQIKGLAKKMVQQSPQNMTT
jgi:glyoxylase-like metal-dependent hydrolase (beta-lactamase superfamily II)